MCGLTTRFYMFAGKGYVWLFRSLFGRESSAVGGRLRCIWFEHFPVKKVAEPLLVVVG